MGSGIYAEQMKTSLEGIPYPYHILCQGDDLLMEPLNPWVRIFRSDITVSSFYGVAEFSSVLFVLCSLSSLMLFMLILICPF